MVVLPALADFNLSAIEGGDRRRPNSEIINIERAIADQQQQPHVALIADGLGIGFGGEHRKQPALAKNTGYGAIGAEPVRCSRQCIGRC